MKSFSYHQSPHRNRRRGISLFEVLIAILVASIGVTGVLVLIPFAVRSAQRGMDREAAINTSKNFFADFQAFGYHDIDLWWDDNTDPIVASPPYYDGATYNLPLPASTFPPNRQTNIRPGWPYLIDPIGAATFGIGNYGQFPSYAGLPDDFPQLNRITLNDDNGLSPLPIELPLARRLAMPQDLLVFDEPLTELGPPVQRYFTLDSVDGVKRQYNGNRSSVVAVVVPLNDAGNLYRLITISLGAGDRTSSRVFRVDDPPPRVAAVGNPRGFEGIALAGGDLVLQELPASLPTDVEERKIRNNDWIMLINFFKPTIASMNDVATYDDVQLSFYRVIHSVPDEVDNTRQHVTLQGPDFDRFRDWEFRESGLQTNPGESPFTNTYAVLIPNALAVYERTIRTEPDSTWVIE